MQEPHLTPPPPTTHPTRQRDPPNTLTNIGSNRTNCGHFSRGRSTYKSPSPEPTQIMDRNQPQTNKLIELQDSDPSCGLAPEYAPDGSPPCTRADKNR